MLLNPITFYYLDPTDLHKTIKDYDEEYFNSIVTVEEETTKADESVQHLIEEAMKIESGEPLSTIDLYALLECEKRGATNAEELLKNYKQMILKFHPDKCHHLGIKDELFKGIQLAYDLLTDPKTRKSYDSMDATYMPHVPAVESFMEGDAVVEDKFYKAYEQYFDQLSHFSVKKMPKFSEIVPEKVGQFYSVWLKYTSWRTFDLDSIMELRSTSGGRDERRHRQKELQKDWERMRKQFAVDTSEAIQLAMKLDPRYLQLVQNEKDEKEKKKEAAKQRKIEMAAKRNGGRLPAAPVKKVVKVSRPNSANKGKKAPVEWTKEESAALIEGIKKFPGGATDRFDKIAQYTKKQCKTDYTRTKEDVIAKMKSIKSGNDSGM